MAGKSQKPASVGVPGTDPAVVMQCLATVHFAADSLLRRLEMLEHTGMLGESQASIGWRTRLDNALVRFRELGLNAVPADAAGETPPES